MSPDFRVSVTEIVGRPTKARLLLIGILNLWWGTQTYVVLDNCETKIVSLFSSLKCEHALVKRQNFQLIRATYAFFGWKTMCLSEKESILMKFSHNHKWDFGCQHFISKWPFRGITGFNKNRRKSLNVIQLHTGKCFILIPNHRYVMTWFCESFPIKSKITCVIMDQ